MLLMNLTATSSKSLPPCPTLGENQMWLDTEMDQARMLSSLMIFDLVYVRPTCSLLVIDRGNAAVRQISLSEEVCEYHYTLVKPVEYSNSSKFDHLNMRSNNYGPETPFRF
ncbi:Uncharacterized protein Rs2_26435 [Raphanus sativus]|nr:Uncharacterized protein Rs2_26435 [Raphanus sativus]